MSKSRLGKQKGTHQFLFPAACTARTAILPHFNFTIHLICNYNVASGVYLCFFHSYLSSSVSQFLHFLVPFYTLYSILFGLSLSQCLFYTLYSLVYHSMVSCCLGPLSLGSLRCFHTVYDWFCIFAPLGYFSLRPSMIILAVSNPGWERSFPISSNASHECIGLSALDLKQPIHSPQRSSVMEIVS